MLSVSTAKRLVRSVSWRAFADLATHQGAVASPPANAEKIGAGIWRLSNIIIEKGKGSYLWTAEGERYLDFACGIGATSLGHCHPEVTKAVHEQVDKVWHAQINIGYHAPMLELVGKLGGVMPPNSGFDTFLFVTTGAEAIEAAVKLARHATCKPNIIVFQGSFHGRTSLTGAMTTSKNIYHAGYSPKPAGIYVAPFPYPGFGGLSVETCLEQLEMLFQTQTSAKETAAVIIEPVLGEGGYIPAPVEFLKGIQRICNQHGVLFIVDEVQSGFGRTGKLFAIERSRARADILVFAKGIASGMPIAGIASRKELCDMQPPGSQGGTYAGHAVACAAANATVEVLTRPGFLEGVNQRGDQLRAALTKMKTESACHGVLPIKDVRGHGLMIGIEFDHDVVPKGTADKVKEACLSRGLIILSAGAFETLRLIPPLNVSAQECNEALHIIRGALAEIASELET